MISHYNLQCWRWTVLRHLIWSPSICPWWSWWETRCIWKWRLWGHTKVLPMMSVNSLGKIARITKISNPVPKAGLFYWLTFTIEYDGNSSFWFFNFYIICLFVSLNFRLFLCSLSGIARRTSLRSFGRGSQNDIHLVPILTWNFSKCARAPAVFFCDWLTPQPCNFWLSTWDNRL